MICMGVSLYLKNESRGCFPKPPGEGQSGPSRPEGALRCAARLDRLNALGTPRVREVSPVPAPTQIPSSMAPPCLALGLI